MSSLIKPYYDDHIIVKDINFALTKSSHFVYLDMIKLSIKKLAFKSLLYGFNYNIANSNKANFILKASKDIRQQMLIAKIALHFKKCIKVISANILNGADEFYYIVGDSYSKDNEIIKKALVKYFQSNEQFNTFLQVTDSSTYMTLGIWFKFENLDK